MGYVKLNIHRLPSASFFYFSQVVADTFAFLFKALGKTIFACGYSRGYVAASLRILFPSVWGEMLRDPENILRG